MFRQLGLVFAAFALLSLAGGHWAVLQSIAWTEMLHDYSQRSGSLAVAVEQTFDGQHPCDLCREIQAGKSREHRQGPVAPNTKDDAKVKALVADSALPPFVCAVGTIFFPRATVPGGPSRTEPPPTPPPRCGAFAA